MADHGITQFTDPKLEKACKGVKLVTGTATRYHSSCKQTVRPDLCVMVHQC